MKIKLNKVTGYYDVIALSIYGDFVVESFEKKADARDFIKSNQII